MAGETFSVEKDVLYATHDGEQLKGTLYRPAGEGPFPAIVALHGGGWRQASPVVYQYLGPWLAERGYVVFAPVYRSAKVGAPTYPKAVHDVRAAVQFVKGAADVTRADPERVALMGESAGGHLAALVALAGEEEIFRSNAPAGPHASLSSGVKAAIPLFGVFDLVSQWRHDLVTRLGDQNIVELFLGTNPSKDRRICFDASPMSYCIERLAKPAFLVAWGTQDDIVDPLTQSVPFVEALKQAGVWTRTVIVEGAPHYWAGDPLDEAGSHSGFFAPRLLRFLKARL
jgi:acetyl esterase/lipase